MSRAAHTRPACRATLAALGLALLAAPVGAAEKWVVGWRQVEDQKAVFATVESVDIARARTRISGTVVRLHVEDGDRVETGQVIAEVDDPKLALELASLDARIDALEARLSQATVTVKRLRQLRATGSASQSQLDAAETAFSVTTGELAAARADREVLRERRREGKVLAPDSGRVLETHVVEGEVVMPGEPVATIAVDRYVLRLRLPERHARFIRVGDPVRVGARGLSETPESVREGRIRKVYPELSNGQVIADVEVSGLGDYFVGERTRVWVATGRRQAIVIPRRFLRTRFGIDTVRVRGADGAPTEVVVQPGRGIDGDEPAIEILSGLGPGDELIEP